PQKAKPHSRPMGACPTSSCAAGAAAPRWRPPPSMRWRWKSEVMKRAIEPGRLYGVGVGPGDPGLLTVRAREVLGAVDVVAHFCKAGRRGIARAILDAALGASRREHAMPYPFTNEVPVQDPSYAPAMRAFYDACADQIATLLGEGLSVAVICEGDPFF